MRGRAGAVASHKCSATPALSRPLITVSTVEGGWEDGKAAGHIKGVGVGWGWLMGGWGG